MSESTIIDPEILAQRLESAAGKYDELAVAAREANAVALRRQFERQAHESREWAHALRNVRSIGFSGDSIELIGG